MQKSLSLLLCSSIILLNACSKRTSSLPSHADTPFTQEYTVKYKTEKSGTNLRSVAADRNGKVQFVSSQGLLHPQDGQFLIPGSLIPDHTYRFMKDKKIAAIASYDQQFVYLTDKVLFANAWAGTLLCAHTLPNASLFTGGRDFTFLVTDGTSLQLVKESKTLWSGKLDSGKAIALRYQPATDTYWILSQDAVYTLTASGSLTKAFSGNNLTAFDFTNNGKDLAVGSKDGYFVWNIAGKTQGATQRKLPVLNITAVRDIKGKLWFGSTDGAYALRPDGKFDFYNGERWLPSNKVSQIEAGPDGSVLVMTENGLGQLHFVKHTLAAKADFYEEQVRARHIRNGFNSGLSDMNNGNIATGFLDDSDNDGLWTSMYLGAEIFRYAVTKDSSALQNCRESLQAMERLYTVNPVPGFPARSFERSGHRNELSDVERWQPSPEKEWDWKSTTSSDEVIGHIFAFGAMAELIEEPALKNKAIMLIDTLMSHVLKNDMYLIDFDGKPTMWGKWNPEYVNSFPTNVGDRKLNSSNIVAMLQTAYHFTGKQKYKDKAFELMNKHGYFENLMRPMSLIGKAPEDADEHAKHMSDGWNHSDDEMYFLGYWGLYRYAFNDTLKTRFKESIIDHWQAERPEKEGAWNIITAVTGTKEFDLKEAVWFLQEHPLDLIDWKIQNSQRKDIDLLEPNFRKQTTKEVLPPDERPIQRHNGNTFALDRTGSNGRSEHSAGDIWLLPYWLGRYLNVISGPVSKP